MAAAVYLLHFQLLVSQITMRNLMFLHERLMESFVQEGARLLFVTAFIAAVHVSLFLQVFTPTTERIGPVIEIMSSLDNF